MLKLIALLSVLLLAACSASYHESRLPELGGKKLTAGVVQKEIRRGMPQGDVAQSLGSPNIVSRDDTGRETWIYDRFASEASYSRSNAGAGFLGGVAGMAGSVLLLGIPAAGYDESSGASRTTQRTLTVVIKFDDRNLVETATFHATSF